MADGQGSMGSEMQRVLSSSPILYIIQSDLPMLNSCFPIGGRISRPVRGTHAWMYFQIASFNIEHIGPFSSRPSRDTALHHKTTLGTFCGHSFEDAKDEDSRSSAAGSRKECTAGGCLSRNARLATCPPEPTRDARRGQASRVPTAAKTPKPRQIINDTTPKYDHDPSTCVKMAILQINKDMRGTTSTYKRRDGSHPCNCCPDSRQLDLLSFQNS
jgi:hypothetical protein